MSRVLPILFNTDMVRAILDGRKTVTRRKVDVDISNKFDIDIDGSVIAYICQATGDTYKPEKLCRYKVGDILYVRETWKIHCGRRFDANIDIEYKDGGMKRIQFANGNSQSINRDDYDNFIQKWQKHKGWHPSIHMPKEAARIFLKVTDVRVERLQDITAEQAENEGTGNLFLEDVAFGEGKHQNIIEEDGYEGCIKTQFSLLWDSTCKKSLQVHGWEANPWVWVIEFERCEKPQEEGFDNGWGDAIHNMFN